MKSAITAWIAANITGEKRAQEEHDALMDIIVTVQQDVTEIKDRLKSIEILLRRLP